MNKKYGICSEILIGSFTVCQSAYWLQIRRYKGSKRRSNNVDVPKDNTAVFEDIKQAEKIFNALPSPLESAMLIKSAGARFDQDSSESYR